MPNTPETETEITQVCKICKKNKPKREFIISVGYIKRFSPICAECRNAQADDDEGGGGKRKRFTVDHETKDMMFLEQQKNKEAREIEKQEARENFDRELFEETKKITESNQENELSKEEKTSSEEKTKDKKEKTEISYGADAIFEKNWEMMRQLISGGHAAFSFSWMRQLIFLALHAGALPTLTLLSQKQLGEAHSGRIQSAFLTSPSQKDQSNSELLQIVKETFGKYSGKS